MKIVLRRLAAFAIDCGLLVVYAVVLFALSPFLRPLFTSSPYSAELTGFLLLTLPFGLYFAICEASSWSASIGKRAMKLRVVDSDTGKQLSFSQSLLRNMVKLLPWELAHFAIWHAFVFASSLQYVAMGALTLSYIQIIIYIVGLVRRPHRTLYDRYSHTKVV
jgi:uncharacterized RDD family membrane protein YckC